MYVSDTRGIKINPRRCASKNVSFGTGDYTSRFSILLSVLNDSKKEEREANEQN